MLQQQLHGLDHQSLVWDRISTVLYDIFEPSFLESALSAQHKQTNLGALIFGETLWRSLSTGGEELHDLELDPLTMMFKEHGMFHMHIHCYML